MVKIPYLGLEMTDYYVFNTILTKRVKKWPKMVEIPYFDLEMAYCYGKPF